MPSILQRALRSRAAFRLGALVLTSMFWWSGPLKLWNFASARAEMAHFGLESISATSGT